MSATALVRIKRPYAGGMVEINIWRVSDPVPPCEHCFKYRLVYVVAGQRAVGFDNERSKGDHRHEREVETPYLFTSVEALLADFWTAVDTYGGGGK